MRCIICILHVWTSGPPWPPEVLPNVFRAMITISEQRISATRNTRFGYYYPARTMRYEIIAQCISGNDNNTTNDNDKANDDNTANDNDSSNTTDNSTQ